MTSTWLQVVKNHARQYPQRTALALRDHEISYSELIPLIDEAARLLQENGIRPGDSVALLSPPRPEALITFLACCKLSVLWLSLNPKYKEPEIDYIVGHARPRLILSVKAFDGVDYVDVLDRVRANHQDDVAPVVYFDPQDPTPASLLEALAGARPAGTSTEAAPAPVEHQNPDAACMLVYTSGTTGQPKGVLLSQTASLFRATVQASYFKTADVPRILNFSAINHVGGMQFRSLALLAAGGTIFFQERFKPTETLRLLRQYRINMLMLGPTMLHMLMKDGSFDLDIFQQLEWYISAGAALPVQVLKTISENCPNVATVYGSSESCATVSYASVSDSFDAVAYSIGWPIPANEMRVADRQDIVLGPLQEGELQIFGKHCMLGYLNNPEATEAAFTADGWMKTGDLAITQEDGSLRLIGRIKEMFKSGGYNVYPREVEILLETHPAIKMAAVVPVDDPVFQQVGHAFVLLNDDHAETADGLISWCKERLANYKAPKRIIFCPELPMLAIGKVDKVRLKELANGAPAGAAPN